ncbi:MAG: NUDIX hydrolase [Egibacteraceae bacterium]
MSKHATASVYVLTSGRNGRRLALVRHPRFGKWMVPGGHVEPDENPAETAIREVREETGLEVRLLSPAAALLPTGVTDPAVPLPYWIVEEHVPGDRDPRPHIHVDHLYVAVPAGTARADEDLGVTWYTADQLAALDMFDGTRAFALTLLNELALHMPEKSG